MKYVSTKNINHPFGVLSLPGKIRLNGLNVSVLLKQTIASTIDLIKFADNWLTTIPAEQ